MLTPPPDPYDILLHQIYSTARGYFEELFRKEQKTIIKFSRFDKLEGRHIGILLSIDYIMQSDNTQHSINYFIKVHNQGPQWENISQVNPPDPREAFVYNVLSITGYGSKAHFFFLPDNRDVLCIATQDVSFTKREHREKKFILGSSEEFSKLVVQRKHEVLKLLNTVELLQYLLLLGDILEYADNFGVVTTPENLKIKIVDFSINIPKESKSPTLSSSLYSAYTAKTDMQGYDVRVKRILYPQDDTERIQNVQLCQQEFTMGRPRLSSHESHLSLVTAIDTAQEITERFLHCSQNQELLYYIRLVSNNLRYFLSLQL